MRPDPVSVVYLYGARYRLAGCARCEMVRPLWRRGLCRPCVGRCHRDGTYGDYGYVKADKVADFAGLRAGGLSVPGAAARVGVSSRTGERYEAELDAAGRAPWRHRDRKARPRAA